MHLLEIPILGVLHANTARPIEQQTPRQCTSQDSEVGTCERWLQKRAGGTLAPAVLDGQVADTDAVDLVGASIEVVPIGIALFNSSRDHSPVDGMRLKL